MRRFPHDASQAVQDAFSEISDDLRGVSNRLQDLERTMREGGVSEQDLDAVKADVTRAARTKPPEWDDIFRASGATHALGHVPDPGAAAGTTKFLREDATFAVPAPDNMELDYLDLKDGGAAAADYRLWRDASGDVNLQAPTGKEFKILTGGLSVAELADFSDDITILNTKQINGLRDLYGGAFIDATGIAVITVAAGEFHWDGTVLKAYARRTGGTGATVNIQVGGSDLRSSDLSLTGTAWTDFGTLQNDGITDGEDCDWEIASVTGAPTQIAFLL